MEHRLPRPRPQHRLVHLLAERPDVWTFRQQVDEPVLRPGPREPVLHNLVRPLRDGPFRRYVAFFAAWTFGQSLCGWMWWLFLLEVLGQGKGTWWQGHLYLAAYLLLPIPSQFGSFVGYT